jgi:hypothetical protein
LNAELQVATSNELMMLEESPELAIPPARRKVRKTANRDARHARSLPGDNDGAWQPPQVEDQLRTRLGGSVVDEFVAGHDVTDVLRELVQNEFDAGGSRLAVTFGQDALLVTGTGKPISASGWRRLSVILGTGRVVGENATGPIAPKTNGIGSKNFGLRSLFMFGDRIHVRSNGHVAVLDLPQLATARVRDNAPAGTRGVTIHVPYRTKPFEGLQPFLVEDEQRTLDVMAGGMLATLAKLALPGSSGGLEEVRLRSDGTGRQIRWLQKARTERCRLAGGRSNRPTGRVTDTVDSGPARAATFEEIEFQRSVEVPAEHRERPLPGYYRRGSGALRIAVSLPISRRKIDPTDQAISTIPYRRPMPALAAA